MISLPSLKDPVELLCKSKAPEFVKPFVVTNWLNLLVYAAIFLSMYFNTKMKWFNSLDGKTKSAPVVTFVALGAHFYLMWVVTVLGKSVFCTNVSKKYYLVWPLTVLSVVAGVVYQLSFKSMVANHRL